MPHQEDDDVTEALGGFFQDEGIDLILNARIKRVSGQSCQRVKVIAEQNGIEKIVEGTHILVPTGRVPNTKDLGLEIAGVQVTNRGYVKVNERLETTTPAPQTLQFGSHAGEPGYVHGVK